MAAAAWLVPTMAVVGTGVNLVGRFVQAKAQREAGVESRQAADYEAGQLERMAGEELAAGQREGLEVTRQQELLVSRGRAVAAASGAGASDPTVIDVLSDVEREGSYRAGLARYGGAQRAQGLLAQAHATRLSGKASERGALLASRGTIIGGLGEAFSNAGSFFLQYGRPQPNFGNYIYGP